MCDDPVQVRKSVYMSGYFSVRSSVTDLYAGTEKEYLDTYAPFVQYLGDYYQVAPNWNTQRYEWWNLLQRVGAGGNVADEAKIPETKNRGRTADNAVQPRFLIFFTPAPAGGARCPLPCCAAGSSRRAPEGAP